jgi:uncharacterized protein
MSMNVEQLVKAHVEAFNAGDLDRLREGLAEDVLWMTGTDIVRGRAAVLDLLSNAMSGLAPQLRLIVFIASEHRAACELQETYVHKGVETTAHIAAFFEFSGALITRVKVYREGSADP